MMMEASDWLKSKPKKRLRHISMVGLLKNVYTQTGFLEKDIIHIYVSKR